MKYKLLLRRMSISAPRMRIRTHRPWYVQVLIWLLIVGVAYLGGCWVYEAGLKFAGHATLLKQVDLLTSKIHNFTIENERLATLVNAAESRFQIEKTLQTQLAQQVSWLTSENNRLKEELEFYQTMSQSMENDKLAVRAIQVTPEPNRQWRYGILLTQPVNAQQTFSGSLQLVLTLLRDNKSAMMILPSAGSEDTRQYEVRFRRFQKIEGVFTLPPGTTLKAIQIRVLERGILRAERSVAV